jgi:hypothetical protein
MLPVTADFIDALTGSFTCTVRADAWYDDDLALGDLPVIDVTVNADRDRAIPTDMSAVIAGDDDRLATSSWDAPLAPYGQVVQLRAGIEWSGGTEDVPLGWFRVDTAEPEEWWTSYDVQSGGETVTRWVRRGTQVTVQAADRMAVLDDDRFLVPESPKSLGSAKTEIIRLVRDLLPVADLDHVVDKAIPASIAYQTSRVEAVQALAAVLGCWARVNADGALTLTSLTPATEPVWTVTVNDPDSQILDWGRALDRAGLYNAVISSGTTDSGAPVQGVAIETTGPLRFGGPFGRVPYAHSSPLITTAAAAQADADSRLARLIQERVARVRLRCPANPALELGDTVRLELPDKALQGQVQAMTMRFPDATMEMTVTVPRTQIWGA